jgi:predicted nucleic acid-binding protein
VTRLIVDASVIAKWFLLEEYSSHAVRLIGPDRHLLAPDLVLSELANTLLKANRRGDIPAHYISRSLTTVRELVQIVAAQTLVDDAVRIALAYQRSAYDALYVALAIEEQCPLVTADRKLYDAIAPSLPGAMLWIEDVA